MVVTTKQRVDFNNLLNIDVYIGADRLDKSNCIDYLGVELDAHLTWNSQIDEVCKKLVLTIFRLSRLRNRIAPHNNYVAHLPMCYSTDTRLCNYRMEIHFATKFIESAAFTKSSCPNNNRQLLLYQCPRY